MAYLKYVLFVFGWMSTLQSSAQNYEQFFVQISDATLIPDASHTYNGVKINSTQTIYKTLNNLINAYEIYSVESVFLIIHRKHHYKICI